MVAVLPPDDVPRAIEGLAEHGVAAALVGEVVPAEETGPARYVEGALGTMP